MDFPTTQSYLNTYNARSATETKEHTLLSPTQLYLLSKWFMIWCPTGCECKMIISYYLCEATTNGITSILCFLTFLSFLPQLRRILAKKDSTGISLYYLLYNLISATEQFTLGFYFVISDSLSREVFVHYPVNTGDWLNMAQLTVVWLMSLVM